MQRISLSRIHFFLKWYSFSSSAFTATVSLSLLFLRYNTYLNILVNIKGTLPTPLLNRRVSLFGIEHYIGFSRTSAVQVHAGRCIERASAVKTKVVKCSLERGHPMYVYILYRYIYVCIQLPVQPKFRNHDPLARGWPPRILLIYYYICDLSPPHKPRRKVSYRRFQNQPPRTYFQSSRRVRKLRVAIVELEKAKRSARVVKTR